MITKSGTMRWVEHVSRIGEKTWTEETTQRGRRWENNENW